MIAHAARFVTVLCAALLAACNPPATDAPIPTPALRGSFNTSPQQVRSMSINNTSSEAYKLDDYMPDDSYADGPWPSADARCDFSPCAPPFHLQLERNSPLRSCFTHTL